MLEIEPGGMVCAYHGMSFADDKPIAVFESLFPAERLPGIGQLLAQTSGVTTALQGCGVDDFTRISTRMTAVAASATQALQLQVREGDPLLRTTGLNIDSDGVPVEYGRSWFAGDRVTLTLEH